MKAFIVIPIEDALRIVKEKILEKNPTFNVVDIALDVDFTFEKVEGVKIEIEVEQ